MYWSVRSIIVLQIKHYLTSPPSSHLTQVYTMQRLEVQPNYIYHILGLTFITQVLSFKVPRCLTIYPRLSESYRRGSYLEMPCLDIVEILTCRTSYCTYYSSNGTLFSLLLILLLLTVQYKLFVFVFSRTCMKIYCVL